jgi:molybdopterin-guanine dinucleotide biosynthesis protein B
MPAIVSIIGNSESGKTTLIEKLIRELKSRKYRVATIKHAPEGSTLDEPDKDTSRHLRAGSEATIISSKDKMALLKPVAPDITLHEMARILGEDSDIVLAEGFKQGDAPKIEVHRKDVGPLLKDIKKLVAIATDEHLETKTRQFSLEDITALADFLEKGYIKPLGEQRLSLYVNDTPISLSAFPREFFTSVLLAMANCLKGVGKINTIKVFFKKKD